MTEVEELLICPSCDEVHPETDLTEATSFADHGVCWSCNKQMNVGERCRICYEPDHDINTCPDSEIDFDFGSFGNITNHRSMVVYANQYAVQNIRELPYVWELASLKDYDTSKLEGDWKGEVWSRLGAIWFYDHWLHSFGSITGKEWVDKLHNDLYVDADPQWKKFVDYICKQASREGLDLILFYWP